MANFFLKQLNSVSFDSIYKDMMQQFPKGELKSREEFLRLMSCEDYFLYGAYDDGLLVGYILYATVENKIWLEYIAIKKEFHSKGYGRKILSLIGDCYLEVEKPDEKRINTIRRIKFYVSLGAKKLDIDYYYPNKDGSIPMDLYYLGKKIPSKTEALDMIKKVFEKLHSNFAHVKDVLNNIK